MGPCYAAAVEAEPYSKDIPPETLVFLGRLQYILGNFEAADHHYATAITKINNPFFSPFIQRERNQISKQDLTLTNRNYTRQLLACYSLTHYSRRPCGCSGGN